MAGQISNVTGVYDVLPMKMCAKCSETPIF